MPDYEITSPDGNKFIVTAPEGATQDQVLAYAQQQFAAQHPATKPQNPASSGADVPLVQGMQGYDEQQAAQQKQTADYANANPDPSLFQKIGSGASAIGRSVLAAPLGMVGAAVGGLHGALNGGGAEQQAQDVAAFTAPAMYGADPLTKEYIGKAGDVLGALDPAMGGVAGEAQAGIGKAASNVAKGIADEASLVPKSASDLSNAFNKGVDESQTGMKSINTPEIKPANDIAERIKAGSTENDLAPFKLVGDKVVDDPHAKAAMSQGWEDGTVQSIKQMDSQTTDAAKEMLNIAEQGRKDKSFQEQNSPTVVIGDALAQNINFIKKKNTDAGRSIDKIAENLPNEPMDVSAPINKFINDLEEKADIKFPRDENGNVIIGKDNKITPNYDGSILEGDLYKSDRDFLQKTLNRLTNTGSPTPLNVHRAKRYIDDSVTWGKGNQSTVRPEIERAAKSLRVGLDDALDQKFPEYDKANVQYKDTVTALDGLQDAAGKKLDFFADGANQQLGTLSRRLMQNVTSRQELQNAITKLQDTSLKYGNPKTVDINSLGSFGADLEKVYKNSKPYSFQAQSALGAARAAHGDVSGAVHTLGAIKDFALRRTPEKQFNTLSSLIEQQRIKHIRDSQTQPSPELNSTDMVTQ